MTFLLKWIEWTEAANSPITIEIDIAIIMLNGNDYNKLKYLLEEY